MARYEIPVENWSNLEKKLARIQRKCAKYGNEFNFEKVDEIFKDIPVSRNKTVPVKYIVIDVEGIAKVNDWEFVGTIQHMEGGNIVSTVGGQEVPDRFYTCPSECEHCHRERNRKDTYIVKNLVNGDFKQLGKACLKDFTNGLDSELVAAYESFIKDVEDAQELDMDFYGGGSYRSYIDLEEYLTIAAECVIKFGFVKSQKWGDYDYNPNVVSTWQMADKALDIEHNGPSETTRATAQKLEQVGFDVNDPQAKELAAKALEWLSNKESDEPYIHNLKAACSSKYIERRNMGLVASLIAAYKREVEYQNKQIARENERKSQAASSQFVGEIGDKIVIDVKKVELVTSWDTDYGMTFLYRFIDKDDNVYIWKTGNIVGDEIEHLKGTIKDHSEYNGVKQNVLTRCKAF